MIRGPDLSNGRLEEPELAVSAFAGAESIAPGEGQMANLDSLIEDFQKPALI